MGKLPKKPKFFGNLPWKIEIFCEITWRKSKFFRNLPWKSESFVKLHENIEIFRKFALKNRFFCLWNCPKKSNFVHPSPRPPRFQTRLTPLSKMLCLVEINEGWCLRINVLQQPWQRLLAHRPTFEGALYKYSITLHYTQNLVQS